MRPMSRLHSGLKSGKQSPLASLEFAARWLTVLCGEEWSLNTPRVQRSLVVRTAAYVWASPTTLVGLLAGGLTISTGGTVRIQRGVLEFSGGFSSWLLRSTPVNAVAMTLGHVIIGRDIGCLAMARDHEHVHVRQVELWGVAFIPAYLAASAWAALRGRHYYRDNWFEKEVERVLGSA
jgi:hypothetical protein